MNDIHELVKAEVRLQVKPIEQGRSADHEAVMRKLDEVEVLLKKMTPIRVSEIIQYAVLLIQSMLILNIYTKIL